jgi:hypothetical protein
LEPEKCKIYKKFKVVGQQYYNTSQKWSRELWTIEIYSNCGLGLFPWCGCISKSLPVTLPR